MCIGFCSRCFRWCCRRMRARGERSVVGVNRFTEAGRSPLSAGNELIQTISESAERRQIERLKEWRAGRNPRAVEKARGGLKRAARGGGAALRDVFGESRAPTGVGRAVRNDAQGLGDVREAVDAVSRKLGRRLKFLVG